MEKFGQMLGCKDKSGKKKGKKGKSQPNPLWYKIIKGKDKQYKHTFPSFLSDLSRTKRKRKWNKRTQKIFFYHFHMIF